MTEIGASPKIYAGVKWGLAAPTVMLLAQYFPPPQDHIFIVREFYREGMLLEDLIREGKKWNEKHHIRKVFCDPSEPEFIARLRKHRLWAVAVGEELTLAVNMVIQRLANFKAGGPGSIAIASSCPNLLAEMPRYRTAEKKSHKPFRDKPLDLDNYALSALHFLVVGLGAEKTVRVRWI